MDSAGRLVIPSEIRRQAGLRPGEPLEINVVDGRIEIEPAVTPVRLERRGRLLVAVPIEPVAKLDRETVERTRAELLREREETH
jgi:AbrB family looped-hinge helix DNA binding protein